MIRAARRGRRVLALLLLAFVAGGASAKQLDKAAAAALPETPATRPAPASTAPTGPTARPAPPADRRIDPLLATQIAALAPQRPGQRDLYVLAFAGDGGEQVFRNEALYLRDLAAQRFDAAGRSLVLANHPADAGAPALPAADAGNLRAALAAIGSVMDREEDLLLLYLSSHGSPQHAIYLSRPGQPDSWLTPRTLRAALDASGIRHRVVVVSACFAGGFANALADPDTLVLMAARKDRASFGCSVDSTVTYFGDAFLVEALNQSIDFEAAFDAARTRIAGRERSERLQPSLPQRQAGARIGATLADWRRGVAAGPALAYPWPREAPAPAMVADKGLRAKQRR